MLPSIRMPKLSKAILQLPPSTERAIEKLGADLAVARLRRKESLRTWAARLGVSVATLQRLESGDPSVGIGIVASALWLIQRDGELANIASPENDQGALERDVRAAIQLGRDRAIASAEARLRKRSQQTNDPAPSLHEMLASFDPNKHAGEVMAGVDGWVGRLGTVSDDFLSKRATQHQQDREDL